jgi:hypothetical protein
MDDDDTRSFGRKKTRFFDTWLPAQPVLIATFPGIRMVPTPPFSSPLAA